MQFAPYYNFHAYIGCTHAVLNLFYLAMFHKLYPLFYCETLISTRVRQRERERQIYQSTPMPLYTRRLTYALLLSIYTCVYILCVCVFHCHKKTREKPLKGD